VGANESSYPNTPVLNKLKEVHEQSQLIGEFLDWLQLEKHVHFVVYENGQPYVPNYTVDSLLHEYFGIDPAEEEKERRAVLEWLGRQQKQP
jgi:hypothetical protein